MVVGSVGGRHQPDMVSWVPITFSYRSERPRPLGFISRTASKHNFQVHGLDAEGAVVEKRRLRRGQVLSYFAKLPPCRIGIEACATAHFWARELCRLGHDVRLIPPQYVKAYLKRGKNDAADAAAIREAVSRPGSPSITIPHSPSYAG